MLADGLLRAQWAWRQATATMSDVGVRSVTPQRIVVRLHDAVAKITFRAVSSPVGRGTKICDLFEFMRHWVRSDAKALRRDTFQITAATQAQVGRCTRDLPRLVAS